MDEDNCCEFSTKNRYFSFKFSEENCSNMLGSISKVQLLRTFWSFHWDCIGKMESKKIVDEVCNVLLCLRVLSLRNFDMVKLPKSIKHLKHLRYLNLANTKVKRLPKAVCSLYNLRTLILLRCVELVELPKNIGSLINLHYLDIRETSRLKKMPPGLGNLKELRTLSKFIVGKRKGSNINELRELQHLCGELQISNLQNIAGIAEDILEKKKHLEHLRLEWTRKSDDKVVFSEHEERVLQRLQPCPSINKLSISGYGGKKLPDWIGDSSYVNIVYLDLDGCNYCTFFPTFELSSLKHLSISNCDALTKVSMMKPLRSLVTLLIENMGQWEKWSFCEENDGGKCGEFMRLEKLTIKNCPKLNAISPSGASHVIFYSLNCLIVEECPNLKIFNLVAISNFKQLATVTNPPNPSPISQLEAYGYHPNDGVILEQLPSRMYSLFVKNLRTERIEEMGIALNGLEEIIIRASDLCERIPLELFPVLKSQEECENRKCQSVSGESFLQPLTNLTRLKIYECENLKSLPDGMYVLSSLRDLHIELCKKLESFPEGGLPANLKLLVKLVGYNCWSHLSATCRLQVTCLTTATRSCNC